MSRNYWHLAAVPLAFLIAGDLVAQSRNATGKAMAAFEAAHPGVERIGGAVEAPKLVRQPKVDFPEAARKKKRELSPIMVMAVVSELGEIVDPTIVISAHPDLDPSVLATIRQWKYQPARRKGKPVKVFLVITVTLEPSHA